jgi:hypothetical protein
MNGGEEVRGFEKVHIWGRSIGSHSPSTAVIPVKWE